MVFVSKKQKKDKEKNYTINDTYGRKAKTGDVGLEIEVEGEKLLQKVSIPWTTHRDGSLRGKENAEYVFDGPVAFDAVDKAVDDLWAGFAKNGTKFDDSNRTSVHVHLNVGDFYLNRLTSLFAFLFTFEDILTHWCGDTRVGNLFCLRAKDAPGIISTLRTFIVSGMQNPVRDNHHYANINANSLNRQSSIEVRCMRGVSEPETVKTWVKILRRLYDASANYPDPRRVCEALSYFGSAQFMTEILGEFAGPIQHDLGWSDQQINDSLYEGVRFAQELAYSREWEGFKEEPSNKDVFGRRKSKGLVAAISEDMEYDEEMTPSDWDQVEPTSVAPATPQPQLTPFSTTGFQAAHHWTTEG